MHLQPFCTCLFLLHLSSPLAFHQPVSFTYNCAALAVPHSARRINKAVKIDTILMLKYLIFITSHPYIVSTQTQKIELSTHFFIANILQNRVNTIINVKFLGLSFKNIIYNCFLFYTPFLNLYKNASRHIDIFYQ